MPEFEILVQARVRPEVRTYTAEDAEQACEFAYKELFSEYDNVEMLHDFSIRQAEKWEIDAILTRQTDQIRWTKEADLPE